MLYKLWYTFAMIFNRDRIPKLPRGMLASHYDDIPGEERRVMARLGARDPRGVKVAMKRYGVKTIPELVALLEHQKPKRHIGHRLGLAVDRLIGSHRKNPHQAEISRQERHTARNRGIVEIKERLNQVRQIFHD